MTVAHADMANAIRFLSADAVQQANSGHPGMPMGMADVATVLFTKYLKFDATDPNWPDRDRFVLSAGHGSMLIYSLLYLTGYEAMTVDQLRNFRQLGSITAGHPEYGHAPGVETTTGPLGQGLTTAVGMALAERMMNARYGDDLVDHPVVTRFLGTHEEVALGVVLDAIGILTRALDEDVVELLADLDDLAGVDFDVRRLPLESAGRLMNHDPRIGQRIPLARCTGRQQQRAHRHGLTNANG